MAACVFISTSPVCYRRADLGGQVGHTQAEAAAVVFLAAGLVEEVIGRAEAEQPRRRARVVGKPFGHRSP
jgi:hypothetical protein